MKKIIIINVFLGILIHSYAQSILLKENFEDGTLPSTWSQKMTKGNFQGDMVYWQVRDETSSNPNPNPYADSAAFGKYYPFFYYTGTNGEATKLITPPINMLGRVKPVMEFYFYIKRWNLGAGPKNNSLKILYKNENDTVFKTTALKEYSSGTTLWIKDKIQLPDSILMDNFYLAFEATNLGGGIIGIDSVKIYETDVAPRQILKTTLTQPYRNYLLSGTNMNPMARLDVYVGGNQNSMKFNSLEISSLNTNDNDILPNGVKLYYTSDTFWNNPVQIPATASFISGKALLNNINHELSSGINSFWISYDLAPTANPGNLLDLSIGANDILINSATFPNNELNPSGSRSIRQRIFSDDFETNKGWELRGDFELSTPNGLGGSNGLRSFGLTDPLSAYSGTIALGNDITGLEPMDNDENGNILPNLVPDDSCFVISPSINCKYFKNTILSFQRVLGIHYSDNTKIEVSNNGGTTWKEIWNNSAEGGSVSDNQWKLKEYDISSIADRASNVKIRFYVDYTGDNALGCGWNIDDLAISGDSVKNDIGITEWISPKTGCGLSNAETVTVKVHNFTNKYSKNIIPISYTFDGITIYKDTIDKSLRPEQDTIYTFKHKIDLSSPAYYPQVKSKLLMENDDDIRNDSILTRLYSMPYFQAPFSDDLETNDVWLVENANSLWQYGKPAKDNLKSAHSGIKAYSTYRQTYYNNNETGYIISPCINTSNLSYPVISFYYNSNLEIKKDGVSLQYTLDDGNTWLLVPNHAYSWKGNWYNNSVEALGTKGWDTTTYNWVWARQVLPIALAGKPSVKFRFLFKSNATETFEGFSFDDFSITEAPIDIKVDTILKINNKCLGVKKDTIGFTITNNGIKPILPGEKLNLAYSINDTMVVWEEFSLAGGLATGGSTSLEFAKTVSYPKPGNYIIKVFIKEPYPGFYESSDDTAKKTKIVFPLPVSGLPDTFSSLNITSLVINPVYDANNYYTWPDNTHNSTWTPTTEGIKWVNIKDANTCSIQDTFYVHKLIRNLKASTILNPHSDCKLASSGQVSFSIINVGTDTIKPADIPSVTAWYSFNNGTPVSVQTFLTQNIVPGDSLIAQFSPTISPITAGKKIKVYFTKLTFDADNANDTLTNILAEYGYPTFKLGNDTNIFGYSYTLDAGAGFKSYLWSDNSTNRTYAATQSGIHWAEVTDIHNCSARDTINLSINSYDVSVCSLKSPLSACKLPGMQDIILIIKNTGTTKINAGKTLHIGFKLNNESFHYEDSVLTTDFIKDDSIVKTFHSKKIDLSIPGTYKITAHATFADDMNKDNDTLENDITNLGIPFLNLAKDTTLTAMSVTLDAQAGPDRSFLWSDGKTTATNTLTQNGVYSVIVTDDITKCKNYDTIQVNLITPDAGVWEIIRPATYNQCSNSFNEISFNFNNTGNTILQAGKTINAGFIINGTTINKIFTLTQDLAPGNKYKCIFKDFSNTIVIGVENDFTVFASFDQDINNLNDTAKFKAMVYQSPVFDIGDYNKTIISYNSPVKFDAGPGFNYLWSNGKTDQKDTIYHTGTDTITHWVKITNNSTGCSNTDSVRVFIMKPDIEVKELLTSDCRNQLKSAMLNLENRGNTTIKANEPIFIDFYLNETNKTDIVSPGYDIAPNGVFTYSMAKLLGEFTIETLSGIINMDINSTINNDINTTSRLQKTIEVKAPPSFIIDNGADTITVADNYILKINNIDIPSNYTYLWQDGSTTDNLPARDPGGLYIAMVTDKNTQCSATDSLFVKMNIFDIAVKSVNQPLKSCLGDVNDLEIEFKNTGSLSINDPLIYEYNLNGKLISSGTVNMPSPLAPGDSYIYYLTNLKSYLQSGTNSFLIVLKYDKDQRKFNDTIKYQFNLNQKPLLTLSKNGTKIRLDNTPVISAGDNANYIYNWNNGLTERIITIEKSGNYTVTAEDPISHCVSKDSANIILVDYDLSASIKASSENCLNQFNNIDIIITNAGMKDFPASTGIKAIISINDEPVLTKQIELSEKLASKEILNYSISGFNKYLKEGAFKISVSISTSGDVYKENDTVSIYHALIANPKVKLKDTTYLISPYVLSVNVPESVSVLWSNGESKNEIIADEGSYWVRLTNITYGCISSDTTYVKKAAYNGTLTDAKLKEPACFGSDQTLIISYKNLSQAALPVNDTLIFNVKLNNSAPESFKYKLTNKIAPDETIDISFNIKNTSMVSGNNNFIIAAMSRRDFYRIDDTLKKTLEVLPLPSIILAEGQNEVYFRIFYTLDAGPGYASYLWNNNETKQSILVTNQGWYKVTVSNNEGCYGSDSVKLIKGTPVDEIAGNSQMQLYPVPAKDWLNISIKNISAGNLKLEIISMDQKIVLQKPVDLKDNGIEESIHLQNWKSGMYYIKLYSGNTVLNQAKFMIR